MNINTNHNVLHMCQPDGRSNAVSFSWPVSQVLQHDRVLIVRVDPPVGVCDNRNVYGVAPDGKVLWQIEPVRHGCADSPYTGLALNREGAVLSSWGGTDVVADPITGKIIRQSQGK